MKKLFLLLLPLLFFNNVFAEKTYHETYITNLKNLLNNDLGSDFAELTYDDNQQTGVFTINYTITDDEDETLSGSVELGTENDIITYTASNNSNQTENLIRTIIVSEAAIAAGLTKGYTKDQSSAILVGVEDGIDSYEKYGYDIELNDPFMNDLSEAFTTEALTKLRIKLNSLNVDYNNVISDFSMDSEQEDESGVNITVSALGYDTTKTCEVYTEKDGTRTLLGEMACDGVETLTTNVSNNSDTIFISKVKGSDFYRKAYYSVGYGDIIEVDNDSFNYPAFNQTDSKVTNDVENPQTGLKSSIYMFILIGISCLALLIVNKNKIFKKL